MNSRMRTAMSTAALLILVVVITALGCSSTPPVTTNAQGEYNLAMTYHAGETLVFEGTETDQTTADEEMLNPGESPLSTQEYSDRVTGRVKAVDEKGVATVEVTLEQLKNIDAGEEQPRDPTLVATVQIDSTGRVLAVKGYDNLGDRVRANGDLTPVFDYFSVGYALENVIYPEDGLVKVGDEWTDESTIPLPGMTETLSTKTTAKLTSVVSEHGKQVAVIDYSGEWLPFSLTEDMSAEMRQEARSSGFQGDIESLVFKVTMGAGYKYSGQIKIDLATGQPISDGGDIQEMSMDFTVTEAPADLVPQDERGPFGATATGKWHWTRVK